MSKTKKKKIKSNTDISSSILTNHFVYNGHLRVSLLAGKQLISNYEYKNAGTKLLFRFLCECLRGSYTTADKYRPTKIRLFYNSQAYPTSEGTDVRPETTAPRSMFVPLNTVPDIYEAEEQGTYKTVLHFLIPYAYMTPSTGSGGSTINQVCLYSSNTTDSKDYSAYFYLTNSERTEWNAIDFGDAASNYNLIIEWEMSISN